MENPKIPKNEKERLNALKEYSILDTLPKEEYEDIANLASQICQTPVSLITLIDDKRQWFKSHIGVNASETPRNIAFCAHAINDPYNIMIVPDSRKDIRFHDNPLVTGEPHVIFYAGVPLVNPDGYPLGTLCVIDNKPNELNEVQLKTLKSLSNQIITLFEFRKNQLTLKSINYELESQNLALTQFANVTAHDLKSPLSNIIMLADLLESDYSNLPEQDILEFISLIGTSSSELLDLIDGILRHSKETHLLSTSKEEIHLTDLIRKVIDLVGASNEVIFTLPQEEINIFSNKIALKQILINLITNGIKYNDKDKIRISIRVSETDEFVRFNIEDNGPGIREENKERLFQIFETSSNTDREGKTGIGIGLATVKTLVEGLGGTVHLETEIGKGSNFEFTIKKN